MDQKSLIIDIASDSHIKKHDLAKIIATFEQLKEEYKSDGMFTVSVITENRLHEALLLIGALYSSTTINMIKPGMTANEYQNVLEHAQPDLILSDNPELFLPMGNAVDAEKIINRSKECQASDYNLQLTELNGNLLLYTSGTTGKPKGVFLTGEMIAANINAAIEHFDYQSCHVSASLLPLHHIFSITNDLITMVALDKTCVILPAFDIYALQTTVELLNEYKVNYFSGVPVIFETMLLLGADFKQSHLRFIIAGAAPLKKDTCMSFKDEFGIDVIACYGMVEAANFITATPVGQFKEKSVGVAIGMQLKVILDNEQTAATGDIGEIVVKGPSVIADGYFKQPEQKHLLETKDGYFRTGDLGYMDKEGFVYISGRKKNMVIRGADKIYLEDIDRLLHQHQDIQDAGSFPLIKGDQPERIISFVQLKSHAEISSSTLLTDYIEREMGSKYQPDELIIIPHIPRTPTGKLSIPLLADVYETIK